MNWLLPQCSVYCFKCHKTVPCHESWFEQSTVMCPSCFAESSPIEKKTLNTLYADSARITRPLKAKANPPFEEEQRSRQERAVKNIVGLPPVLPTDSFDSIAMARQYSDEMIMRMPVHALKNAVEKGYISRPRMNIELNRRKNTSYYNSMPDKPGMAISQIFRL